MNPKQVIYRGDIYSTSGYARAVRSNIRALIENGVEVFSQPQRHDNITFEPDDFWKKNMNKILRVHGKDCKIRITQQTPDLYQCNPLLYEIGYTVFETSRIPDWDDPGTKNRNWVSQLNKCNEVWTASEFCRSVFKDSGVTVPVKVFPHPIDLDLYKPGPRKSLVIGNEEVNKDKMVFLSVFQWNKRKDPYSLLLAWWAEFARNPDVSLVIKTYAKGFDNNDTVIEIIRRFKKECFVRNDVGNVYIFTSQLDDAKMVELYRSCDVLVTTTKGEGFGLPVQEAQACGLPCVYPRSSALTEFAYGWPVRTYAEPAHGVENGWYTVDMNWWPVDVEDLRKQLRSAFNLWKSSRSIPQEWKSEARSKVLDHSYKQIGSSMLSRLAEIKTESFSRINS